MEPLAGLLALQGWEPYKTKKGRYVVVNPGLTHGGRFILCRMIMGWPESLLEGKAKLQWTTRGEARTNFTSIEWDDIPEAVLEFFHTAFA